MLKYVATLQEAAKEIRLALKELRDVIAALEEVIASPSLVTLDETKKQIKELVASIKTKGI